MEPTDFRCDQCNAPLVLQRIETGGVFSCTQCRQAHTFQGGQHFYILATLYPSSMPPRMKLEQYLPWAERQYRFQYDAQLFLGILSVERHRTLITDLEHQLAEERKSLAQQTEHDQGYHSYGQWWVTIRAWMRRLVGN